jgi:hypothetical protein
MKAIRIFTFAVLFALSFSLGLHSQTVDDDTGEAATQPDYNAAPATEQQTTTADESKQTTSTTVL